MSTVSERVASFLSRQKISGSLLLAVSGGVDSSVMTHAVFELISISEEKTATVTRNLSVIWPRDTALTSLPLILILFHTPGSISFQWKLQLASSVIPGSGNWLKRKAFSPC